MKYQKIIIPEIMLGNRGPDWLIKQYTTSLNSMVLVSDSQTDITDARLASSLQKYPSFFSLLLCAKKHINDGKTYYLTKNLGDALQKIDKKLPVEYLPQRSTFYVSFPDNYLKSEGKNVEGAYVSFYIRDMIRRAAIAIVVYEADGRINCSAVDLTLNGKKVSELVLETSSELPDSERSSSMNLFRLLLNVSLYINSEDPEIMSLKPECKINKIQKKEQRAKSDFCNQCTIPIDLLNWSYHGKTFTKESTMVSGHFRWQPCGEGRQQVKLIYINEHERKYDVMLPCSDALV